MKHCNVYFRLSEPMESVNRWCVRGNSTFYYNLWLQLFWVTIMSRRIHLAAVASIFSFRYRCSSKHSNTCAMFHSHRRVFVMLLKTVLFFPHRHRHALRFASSLLFFSHLQCFCSTKMLSFLLRFPFTISSFWCWRCFLFCLLRFKRVYTKRRHIIRNKLHFFFTIKGFTNQQHVTKATYV